MSFGQVAETHFKHEFSVLNSIRPKGGLSEFWEKKNTQFINAQLGGR